ncbi:tetratricopeptide repeat protein [Catenulispora pinisilvae]|uniref:tetratricopeptide repeat protein n=1 Tax=Catenulispora pinisilvae TaxID=2705253 RepID=UPI0018926681
MIEHLDRFKEAEHIYRKVIAMRMRVLGPAHSETLVAQHNLSNCLRGQERPAKAASIMREVVAGRTETFGASSDEVIRTRHELACALAHSKQYPEAADELRATMAVARIALPSGHQTRKTISRTLSKILPRANGLK